MKKPDPRKLANLVIYRELLSPIVSKLGEPIDWSP